MVYKNRYNRNMNTLSPEENARLKEFRVFIAGCGGLGGFLVEELGRLGVGSLTCVDGDVFEESNLNRQLLSTEGLLGTPKAQAAALRMEAVNSEVKVKAITAFIGEENCRELIKGHDLVLDALDNMSARKVLENACEAENIPMVHGAIAGWFGQVSTVMPGDGTMKKIYPTNENKGMEVELGNPSFTPAVIASIQVAEAVKVLLGRSGILQNKLLAIDLLNHEYEVLEL